MSAVIPESLGEAGSALWSSIVGKYELRPDELVTLQAACGQADMVSQIEDALVGESLMITGSQGQMVLHPLISEVRQHRSTLARLLAGLKLPDESGERPNQQRQAAQSRWAAAHGRSA